MENKWNRKGNAYIMGETSQQQDKLESKIYIVSYNQNIGLFLTQTDEDFKFPYKIYGKDNPFISRVLQTYKNTTANLGFILNGVKGGGKTVTAKLICNALKLPVIMVTENHDGISEYINRIQQDVIILIDEYEKIYGNYDSTILTLMDGVLSNEFRRTFMLTTNEMNVNANLLSRPGRIRYIKKYGDLDINTITEIVDDLLIHKDHKEETIKFIAMLEMITIDIVKSIVEEVNIHNESPQVFKDVFNVKPEENYFKVTKIDPTGAKDPVTVSDCIKVSPVVFNEEAEGLYLYIESRNVGTIDSVIDENTVLVDDRDLTVVEGKATRLKTTYRLQKVDKCHSAFYGYDF